MRRIAFMLLSLAVLADRAACSGLLICRKVLCLLRPAEAVARAFAEESGCALSPLGPDDGSPFSHAGPDDAQRLAEQFRALAMAFFALAHLCQCLAIAAPRRNRVPVHLAHAASPDSPLTAQRLPYFDTS